MPTLVTFYALSETPAEQDTELKHSVHQVSATPDIVKAAHLCQDSVSKRAKVTVLCADKKQAEAFDEFIWAYPSDSFIPHNLYGEGPDMGTPVEVIWLAAYQSMSKLRNTAVVINLSQSFIDNHQNIKRLVDFVPTNETQKADARERYKAYKKAGCQLEYNNL